jgi:hypothetical protein
MVKPLGTVSHALETVWNPHWDTNRVSPCNYAIKSYNEREVVGPLSLWNCAMKLCIIYFIPKFHILETGTVKLSIETGLKLTIADGLRATRSQQTIIRNGSSTHQKLSPISPTADRHACSCGQRGVQHCRSICSWQQMLKWSTVHVYTMWPWSLYQLGCMLPYTFVMPKGSGRTFPVGDRSDKKR